MASPRLRLDTLSERIAKASEKALTQLLQPTLPWVAIKAKEEHRVTTVSLHPCMRVTEPTRERIGYTLSNYMYELSWEERMRKDTRKASREFRERVGGVWEWPKESS